MSVPLKVLLLEDCEQDELLLTFGLEEGGYSPSIERVWTEGAMSEALTKGPWDLVISDFNMPSFNAMAGLSLLKRSGLDIPFIIVSGTIGEERAVAAMKAGAADYVPKGNLARLIPAIGRELAESKERNLRRETQHALAAAEANFRALVENSIAGIYVIQDEKLAYVNPTVTQILGYSGEELSSRPLVDFVCQEERDTVQRNIRKRMEGAVSSLRYTLRMVRKDGSIAHIEAHGAKTDYNGRPSILGILTDITQRKRAEERFSTIFRSSPVGITLSSLPEGQMVEANEAFLEMVGYSREEVIGRKAQDLGLWADPDDRLNVMEKLLAQGSVNNVEGSFRAKSGAVGYVLASFELVEINGERCVLAFFHDITEKKKIEAQFLRNQRMESIGTLAGGIAHDLNNALAPILMSVQLLRMKYEDPEAQQMLDVLQSSAQRGADMVKQVLTFARGAEGKHVTVQLKHLMRDMLAMTKQTFPKNIQIKEQVNKELWPVTGDATQLHQVLLNLCVNARDAMPDGGTLTLTAECRHLDENYALIHPEAKPGPYTVVSVIDTGTGIPPHIQERIFEPFFTTKEVGKGTGLGLSTVRGIIKGHGGFMTFETGEGKGTHFKVFLPAQAVPAGQAGEGQKTALPAGNGECILVVDDEAVIRDIARQVLQAFGYEVLVANNGAEAVALCARNIGKVRVMLTDMMMPVMDGGAATEAVRSIDPQVKVIIASAEVMESRIKNFDPSKAQGILQKPYTPEKLLQTIHEVLHPGGPAS